MMDCYSFWFSVLCFLFVCLPPKCCAPNVVSFSGLYFSNVYLQNVNSKLIPFDLSPVRHLPSIYRIQTLNTFLMLQTWNMLHRNVLTDINFLNSSSKRSSSYNDPVFFNRLNQNQLHLTTSYFSSHSISVIKT
jgi:hypothetical protein